MGKEGKAIKILFICNSTEGTLKQRVIMPAKYLHADVAHEINVMSMQAKIMINIFGTMKATIRDMNYYDIIILQFAWHDDLVFLIDRLNKLGIKVVLDFDDDYFHRNPYYPIDYSRGRMDNLIKSMSMADMITVTTESLAKTYSKYNSNVKILPNMIDISEFKPKANDGKVVGWYSSGIRFAEFRDIVEGWIPENVCLYLAGSTVFNNFKHKNKIVVDRFNPVDTPKVLAMIDIGLIPLKLCRFNDGKSDLKGLEYGAMNIPFIASSTEPYKKLVRHGINGFLVKHSRDWNKYIKLLIVDDRLRYDMGKAARKVSESRDIKLNINLWEEAYNEK